jgi:hypothetical protein
MLWCITRKTMSDNSIMGMMVVVVVSVLVLIWYMVRQCDE